MFIFYKISTILLLTLLTIFSGFAQSNERSSGNIQPSTIITDIIKKKKQSPKITDQALADYANEILAKKGLNYNFEMSELFFKIKPRKEYPENMKEIVINFPFEFTLGDNGKKTFNLTAKHNLMNQCFDESFPAFPVTQVTKTRATVLVEGKPVTVKIPKEMSGLSVFLMDTKTKKKVLQQWVIPYNYGISADNFVGISTDGKKLYLAVGDSYVIDYDNPPVVEQLAIEISSDGKLRFVPKTSVKKKFKVNYLQLTETDLEADILMKVTTGGKVYYLAVPDTSC